MIPNLSSSILKLLSFNWNEKKTHKNIYFQIFLVLKSQTYNQTHTVILPNRKYLSCEKKLPESRTFLSVIQQTFFRLKHFLYSSILTLTSKNKNKISTFQTLFKTNKKKSNSLQQYFVHYSGVSKFNLL